MSETLRRQQSKLKDALRNGERTRESKAKIRTAKRLAKDLKLMISSGYDFLSTKHKRRPHYECCGITFINENSLKFHNQEIHEANSETEIFLDIFQCSYCYLDFKDLASFERHFLTQVHVGKRKEMVDKRDDKLMEKVDGHFKCKHCEEKYESKRDLRDHARDYHKTDMLFPCSICDKKFEKTNRLLGHLQTHENNNKPIERGPCKICKKILPLANIERHIIVVHTNDAEKECRCRLCDRKFSVCDELLRHEAIHKMERNYVCKVCGRDYLIEKSLILHEQSVHSGIKIHRCDECDNRFSFLKDLNIHKRLHTGER